MRVEGKNDENNIRQKRKNLISYFLFSSFKLFGILFSSICELFLFPFFPLFTFFPGTWFYLCLASHFFPSSVFEFHSFSPKFFWYARKTESFCDVPFHLVTHYPWLKQFLSSRSAIVTLILLPKKFPFGFFPSHFFLHVSTQHLYTNLLSPSGKKEKEIASL